jgi:NADH-quinone oxidoreductase subunit J
MSLAFYIAAVTAIISTCFVIVSLSAIHALLYLIVSFLSVAVVFFLLGAPFAAALEVIVYAGAIMVLFVFAVMMLNLGPSSLDEERTLAQWSRPRAWVGPVVLIMVLGAELIWVMVTGVIKLPGHPEVGPKQVGLALFGPYLLGVEIASMLLLAGLVAAYHLGRAESGSNSTETIGGIDGPDTH